LRKGGGGLTEGCQFSRAILRRRRTVGISRRVPVPNRHPALEDLAIFIPRDGHLYLRPSVLCALLQAATGGLKRTRQRRPIEVEREAVRPLDDVCAHLLPIKVSRARPLGAGSFDRWWRRSLAAAGVRYRNPHTTRHTFATRWLRRGGRLETLARAMGHESIRTTFDLYGHLDTSDVAADMALMEPPAK
jgi:integrase